VEIKGHRFCENVVGFGSHTPKRKIVYAGHLRDPIVHAHPKNNKRIARKSLGNMYLLQNLFVGTRLK
jgi:hypothetical protein